MRGVIPNHNCLFFFFVLAVLLFPLVFSIHANTLSSKESLTISSKRTIVSLGDDFELGFFKSVASLRDGERWYLGIWYKKISERTYVWVANRDQPLSNSTGTLKISGSNLVLLDISNSPVWSSNVTRAVRTPLVAELLPNGNFVLRSSKSKRKGGILWQSFDYPTDTLLPQMKLGLDRRTGHNRFLTSWKNSYDPTSGPLTFKLDMRGLLPEFSIQKMDFLLYRSGSWDGVRFSGLRNMETWNNFNIFYNFTENIKEVVFTYRVTTSGIYWRLKLTVEGVLQLYSWNSTTMEWDMLWMSWEGECDLYAFCSSYSFCEQNSTKPVCNCFKGFVARNKQLNPPECYRRTKLSCRGDGFYRMKNVKLPDTIDAKVNRGIGLKECKERCLKDCKCMAFASTYVQGGGGRGCVMWNRDLTDVRTLANGGGQDLYVRLASADLA